MANPISVTISPPQASAVGCVATCLPWYHEDGTYQAGVHDETWYQFEANPAAGWDFDHFEWTWKWVGSGAIEGQSGEFHETRTDNPFPDGSPRRPGPGETWRNKTGYYTYKSAVYPYFERQDYYILGVEAVFTPSKHVPLLVRDDATGRLVYDDVTSGQLINGM